MFVFFLKRHQSIKNNVKENVRLNFFPCHFKLVIKDQCGKKKNPKLNLRWRCLTERIIVIDFKSRVFNVGTIQIDCR